MNKWIAEKIGDMVEDKVRGALGIEEEEEDDKKGGFFSNILNRDDDDDDKKGGFFSNIFNRDDDDDDKKKQKEKDDEGFFSRIRNRDDDDDDDRGKVKSSGFDGLFSEQQGACAAGFNRGGEAGGEAGGVPGQRLTAIDNELLDDLMNVAEETSGKN